MSCMTVSIEKLENLYLFANEIRNNVLDLLKNAGSGHLGGSFSSAEILSTLYNYELKIDPANPSWDNRDRFILSKGHAAPALYATLAQKNYFPKTKFLKFRQVNGNLQGHPELITPGVEYIAGFLGQGLSSGCGMALSFKRQNKPNRVFTLIGDGDNLEGQTWEAARFAVQNKLDNLIAIFDYNNLLSDDSTENVLSIINPEEQWTSFGWNVISVDGHNILEIIEALHMCRETKNIPSIIIAHTKKGHGVSIWDDNPQSHGSWGPSDSDFTLAKNELKISENLIKSHKFKQNLSLQIHSPKIKFLEDRKENSIVPPQSEPFNDYIFQNDKLISLREAFGMAISNLAKKYKNFDLFDADVKGGTMTQIFERHFPNRFIQCGIAEQNMISAAAGYHLASGRLPIVTTYAVFTSLLCAAQFRNGVAMQKLPFIIASSHIGIDTGPDGSTHQAIEDLGIFSTFPGVQVLCPSDANKLQACLESAIISKKPTYIRTGRSPLPIINPKNMKYEIGKDNILIEGTDISIFSTGIMVHRSLDAAKKLKELQISAEVIDITSICPLDDQMILNSLKKTNCGLTAEDHLVKNGLGTAISQLSANNYPCLIYNIGLYSYAESGSPEDLAKKYSLTSNDIVKKSIELLKIK